MQKQLKFTFIILLFFALVLIINGIVWHRRSKEIYTSIMLARGKPYRVRNRTYTYPDLPNAVGSSVPKMLNENILAQERNLLQRVLDMLDTIHISAWPSGGTLLGLIRHGCILPWDDDCDIHTSNENIPFFFSQSFVDVCKTFDFEILLLYGVDKTTALTREGAGIRLRRVGTSMPVCDVFFVGTFRHPLSKTNQKLHAMELKSSHRSRCQNHKGSYTHNLVAKIDGWTNADYRFSPTFNKKEIWKVEDIYPLERTRVDGIDMWMPRNPKNVLVKQFGAKCLDEIYVRDSLISHNYPFTDMDFVFKKM